MALLWCEGFDGKTAQLTGAYSALQQYNQGPYVTGRFGTGSAIQGSPNNGATNEFYVVFPSTKTTLFTGVAIKNGPPYTGNGLGCVFNFYSAGTSVLTLRMGQTSSTTPGQITVVRGALNTAGTVLGTSATIMSTALWGTIEMKVVCGTGTSGSIIVRQNGVETLNLTGIDTGSASLSGISLCQRLSGDATNATYGWQSTLDDWYVCDSSGSANNDFLGDLRILNLVPVAAGSSTQLIPSTAPNWGCVDEIPPVTTDYVGSAGVGFKDLYDVTALGSGYTNIKGVKPAAYAFASDAGVIKGRNTVKSGSSSANGADDTLSATAQVFQDVIENDPATGAAWTNAGLNAAEFGWEVRS